MHHIEFLPTRYRHRRAARRHVLLRVGVLAFMAVGIGAASMWQQAQERFVRRDLAEAEALQRVAEANLSRLAELRAELEDARAGALLCVVLKQPWPRTRLLATVVNAIPPHLELTDLQILSEPRDAGRPSRRAAPPGGANRSEDDEGSPAARDLQRLNEESGRLATVIQLSGAAADAAAVHRLVANLSRERLFARTELASLESIDQSEQGAVTRFEIRIVVDDMPSHSATPAALASLSQGRLLP